MPGPRDYASAPAFTPTPYGLLTAIDFPADVPEHWQNGVNYQSFCADPQSWYDECIAVTGSGTSIGAPPPPPHLINSVDSSTRGATPFTVAVEFDCAAVGNEEARQKAETALATTESWQVERSFWTGLAAGQTVVYPHLAANAVVSEAASSGPLVITLQTAAITVTGAGGFTGSNVVDALGALEGALANCYNGVGIIHIPQAAAPTLDAYGLLHPRGSRMYTANGNKVAIGGGYPGTSPAGAAPAAGTSWLYATGNVDGYKGSIRIPPLDTQTFDKATDTIKVIAQRVYLLKWDCCHFAVPVELGVPKGTS